MDLIHLTSLVAQTLKNLPAMQETQVPSLGLEESPGEGNGHHCSILARRGAGQSMESQRVRYKLSD